jgi:hypothetical protein
LFLVSDYNEKNIHAIYIYCNANKKNIMMHISRFLCGIISKHAKKCLALIDIVFLENHPNNKKIDEKFPLNQNNLVEM